MKILVVSLKRPGHVLHTLIDWWKEIGYDVTDIRLQASYKEQLFGSWESRGPFEAAITAEPAVAFRLAYSWPHSYKKLVYWRIDYRPNKYYQLSRAVDFLCRQSSEVWSIVPNTNYRYVPVLLRPKDFVTAAEGRPRNVLWMGPDLDGSLILARQAVLKIPQTRLVQTDWSSPDFYLSETSLQEIMKLCQVGLVLHTPTSKAKVYSEPSRVKKFLAAGIPVVMTSSFPFAEEVATHQAGVLVEANIESVAWGIQRCLTNFEQMSKNAYEMAQGYLVSKEWVKL